MEFSRLHNVCACLKRHPTNAEFHHVIRFLESSSIAYAIQKRPRVYEQLIRSFWDSAMLHDEDNIQGISATVSGRHIVITQAMIRDSLRLNDADGASIYSESRIRHCFQSIGYDAAPIHQQYKKGLLSSQWRYIAHIILKCMSSKQATVSELSQQQASAMVGLIYNDNFSFSNMIFQNLRDNVQAVGGSKVLLYPRFLQIIFNVYIPGLPREGDTLKFSHMKLKVFSYMKNRAGQRIVELFPHMVEDVDEIAMPESSHSGSESSSEQHIDGDGDEHDQINVVQKTVHHHHHVSEQHIDGDEHDDGDADVQIKVESPLQMSELNHGRSLVQVQPIYFSGHDSEADNMDVEAEREAGISQEQSEEYDLEEYDLPDFTDFNKLKEEHCFEADQIWSVYDTLDRMPRFYVHIRKVYYSSGTFRLLITGLEPEPENSMERIWVKQGLPVACGKFVHGETEEINNRFIFSHLMAYKIGNPYNFSYVIYPKKGEIWAIYQDWNINKWSFHPKSHMKFKYDIVEVLSDFDKESGLVVAYMEKVEGFVSLFQRTSCAEFWVLSSELFKFSHCIPSSKMTGDERADVPVGTHELDTASLPADLDQFYFSNNDFRKAKKEKFTFEQRLKIWKNLDATGKKEYA